MKMFNISPGKYIRKNETQKNWREFFLVVEHVV